MFPTLRKFLIGAPFPNSRDAHERVDNIRALAIFASDPISSNAYATEAIMSVLILISVGALQLTLPIATGVAALVVMVAVSYIQTIYHYPNEGGAYSVAKDNLGKNVALLAAAALLIDYVLTVSVSAAAGVRALTSAFPVLYDYRVLIATLAILFLMWINLRGIRESGTIFAVPTYAFVIGVLIVVVIGIYRLVTDTLPPFEPPLLEHHEVHHGEIVGFAYIYLLLRAFAGGCTALTGIEAISNGVKAFRKPEAKNASITMVFMAITAMALFLGITFVAVNLSAKVGLIPTETESVLSQLSRAVTGEGPLKIMYYWVQFTTMGILFLAANTGFQDFPRVSSYLAKDGFLPRWMSNRGDRLVYSTGIFVLTALSVSVVWIFGANEIAMLPLYAIGVMLCFTLSQAGMGVLFGKIAKLKPGETLKTSVTNVHYETNVRIKQFFSFFGATITGIVLIILISTKFLNGAWIVVMAIPLIYLLFQAIHKHYENVAQKLSTRDFDISTLPGIADIVLVPIGDVNRGTLRALQYAKRFASKVRAVVIITGDEMEERFMRRWERFPAITAGVELKKIPYDYRDILTPLSDYIREVNDIEYNIELVTVVIPEFVATTRWERALHNGTADLLRRRLQNMPDVVIIDVPYVV
ncbi:MAG TPA: APC family permease [Anaerolineales bacterium]|nr:APC family permease [Anaerolineales bacterium]